MSAAKETQPLGSRSGKRGYIRICVVCGKRLHGVGRRTMYCPECRRQRNNQKARERERIKRERAKHPHLLPTSGRSPPRQTPRA